jgi:hypothetical protein
MSNQDWEDGYENGYKIGVKEGIDISWHRVSKDGYIKPLDNDTIRDIDDACRLKNNGILNVIDFARAVEQAHGIRAILRKAQENG